MNFKSLIFVAVVNILFGVVMSVVFHINVVERPLLYSLIALPFALLAVIAAEILFSGKK